MDIRTIILREPGQVYPANSSDKHDSNSTLTRILDNSIGIPRNVSKWIFLNKFYLLQKSGFKIQCVVNKLHVTINLEQACAFL